MNETTRITIQALIASKLKEHNLSRQQLITQIGYKNITKGLRRLDSFLKTLVGPEVFIRKLVKTLEIDALSFHKSMIVSQDEIRCKIVEDKRDRFFPYIDLIFDFTPRNLKINNFIFDSSHIIPPDIRNLPLQEELEEVIRIYKEYIGKCSFTYFTLNGYLAKLCYKPTPEENQMFKDCVIGFRYHRHYHYYLEFNADNVLTKIESWESLAHEVSFKDRDIIKNLRSIFPSHQFCF